VSTGQSLRSTRKAFRVACGLTGCAGVLAGCAPRAAELSPGVSQDLAQQRAADLDSIRYDLQFDVPASRTDPVLGSATIRVRVRDPRVPLVLDFDAPSSALHSIKVGGQALQPDVRLGHIVIPAAALAPGENVIVTTFEAGDAALNRSADFLYTLFVPDRAETAFPCFDQPDLKGRFTLTLETPSGWVAVANGAQQVRERSGRRTRYEFAQTLPISTYLFAFVTGAFHVDSAMRGGRMMHMYHRETEAAKVARNRDAIFDLHQHALEWLQAYTGIPYPFGKFDFVLVPAFQFGGMEHPGVIYYRADALMLDESATQNQILARASTISHETSHMWFGDLVTMRWFDDVWLKEVFANFMAAKIVNPSFPMVNHDLRFFLAHYPAAYEVDRTEGATPIRQPLDNLRNAGTLYGPIIYDKAPIVMRQLELLVGADAFREGLQEYLRRFRFGNATWHDLVDILDRRSSENVSAWSHVWVEEAGRPTISARQADARGRVATIALEQSDPRRQGRAWNEQLAVGLFYGDSTVSVAGRLAGRTGTVAGARGLPTPAALLPGADGLAYGRFELDSASRAYLLDRLPHLDRPLVRGVGWVTLWDAMLEGEVRPEVLISRMLDALPDESDELNVQRILAYVNAGYWRYLTATERSALAPRVEQVVWAGALGAPSKSLAGAYYRAFVSTALTPRGVARLRELWSGRDSIPGLKLSESDFSRLALELAVRGIPDWNTVLDTQAGRITNPDRLAQFDFVRPALSPSETVRDSVFATFKERANRRHEPWVLEALTYLNHPLRAATAEHYILPALQMLREIKETGDIFFPDRWLDATLSGHNTASAAAIIRGFLDGSPDYPPRLRAKVLRAADPVFRAARIVRR
jgi:aminopeptidase N